MPAAKADPIELTFSEVQETSLVCSKFADHFSVEDAKTVVNCGLHHRTRQRLEDPFVDCLVIGIAFDCFTTFREHHGFTASSEAIRQWIIAHVDLEPYRDGDVMTNFKSKFKEF